jgi:hypothetical protein
MILAMREAAKLAITAEEVGFDSAILRIPLSHRKLRHNLKKFNEFRL